MHMVANLRPGIDVHATVSLSRNRASHLNKRHYQHYEHEWTADKIRIKYTNIALTPSRQLTHWLTHTNEDIINTPMKDMHLQDIALATDRIRDADSEGAFWLAVSQSADRVRRLTRLYKRMSWWAGDGVCE